jgi:hypothetical protein
MSLGIQLSTRFDRGHYSGNDFLRLPSAVCIMDKKVRLLVRTNALQDYVIKVRQQISRLL